jgi:hypothetical protein
LKGRILVLFLVCASCGEAAEADPCELELSMAPGYLTRELYAINSSPLVRGEGAFIWTTPYDLPLGEREPIKRVITNEDEYRAFQPEIGVRFRRRVDFQLHDVLAASYLAGGCGTGAQYELLAHPTDGSAVLSVNIFDGSLGAGSSCATIGDATIVVEVTKSARPQVCVTMFGLQ